MLTRFLIRSCQALAIFVVVATPAWADDPYDHHGRDRNRSYGHDRRDQRGRSDHYRHDRTRGLGHGVGDIFRYGTTDPYSSPRHYYRDQHRAYDHYQRDHGGSYQHYSRDRHYSARDHHGDYAHGHYDPRY